MSEILKGLWRSLTFLLVHGDLKEALDRAERSEGRMEELERANERLRERLAIREAIAFEHGVYWTTHEGERKDPVCPTCYLDDEKPYPMTRTADGYLLCPRCKRVERDPDAPPPPEPQPPVSGTLEW